MAKQTITEVLAESDRVKNGIDASHTDAVSFVPLDSGDRVCTRCGCIVHTLARRQHIEWHRTWEGPLRNK